MTTKNSRSQAHEYDWLSPLDASAARPITDESELLDCQYDVIRHILLRCYEIADREAIFDQKVANYGTHQYTRRPSQVYFVDGARGSGKTSVLATLGLLLGQLGKAPETDVSGRSSGNNIIECIKRDLLAEGKIEGVTVSTDDNKNFPNLELKDKDAFSFFNSHKTRHFRRQTAICLPVLHPADLEGNQPLLEAIFSAISKEIVTRKDALATAGPLANEQVRKLTQLHQKLYTKVARGWYSARSSGTDAILRDSVDYDDFLKLMGHARESSYFRVRDWREYVNEVLDTLGAQTMVILLDDADNRPEVTLDILNTIRIFLDHPRIITVLAGNLKQMRQSLLTKELEILSTAIGTLRRASASTEREWRQHARRHTEELLEKVLPRSTRFYMSLESKASNTRPATERRPRMDDYERILGMNFEQYSALMMDRHRSEFMDIRREAHRNLRNEYQELTTRDDRLKLERFMSWWLLRFWYQDALKPRTVRHLLALRAFTYVNPASPGINDRLKRPHLKRLPVILFETPENSELINRFADTDNYVGDWLHRQQIKSNWTGDRYVEINGIKHHADTYPYNYLLYRLDIETALPVKQAMDHEVPEDLLPRFSGPDLTASAPFWPGTKKQELTGIARQLRHSIVPSNCHFLCALTWLPDLAFRFPSDAKDVTRYDHKLIREWHRFFYHELIVSEDPDYYKRIVTYISKIVVPFGVIQLGTFVVSAETASDPKTLLERELKENFFNELAAKVRMLAASIDYKEDLAKDGGLAAQGVGELTSVYNDWVTLADFLIYNKQEVLNEASSGSALPSAERELKALRPNLLSYRNILNDVRRAWHAARIYLAEIHGPLRSYANCISEGSSQTWKLAYDTFSRDSRISIVSHKAVIRWLGFNQRLTGPLINKWIAPEAPESYNKLTKADCIRHTKRRKRDVMGRDSRVKWNARPDSKSLQRFLIETLKEYVGTPDFQSPSTIRNLLTGEKVNKTALALDIQPQVPGAEATKILLEARILRSLVTFINALAPNIPSAAHIDFAALLYANETQSGVRVLTVAELESATRTLGEWQLLISKLMSIVLRYWAACEISKLSQDIWSYIHSSDGNLPPELSDLKSRDQVLPGMTIATLSPDFAYSTLGVRGVRAFADKPHTLLPQSLHAAFDKLNPNPPSGETSATHGIIGEAIENLATCWQYLSALQAVIDRKKPA